MRVLLVNGSSRQNGCTNEALREVAQALEEEGIGTELFFIGNEAIPDCIACRKCRQQGRCVFDDAVAFVENAKQADGFVFGSPVYFAHPSARLLTFIDRAFYSGGQAFAFKPAAAVLSARRAGTTASLDVIQKYFTICSMPVVSSTLESCLRTAVRGGERGSGGPDDHAQYRKEHGLAAQMYRDWETKRPGTSGKSKGFDEFYTVNDRSLIA